MSEPALTLTLSANRAKERWIHGAWQMNPTGLIPCEWGGQPMLAFTACRLNKTGRRLLSPGGRAYNRLTVNFAVFSASQTEAPVLLRWKR